MFEGLLEICLVIDSMDEKEKYFIDRTNKHIQLVQKAVDKIVETYPEYEEVKEQVKSHDASKFEEPERTPYIQLTWSKKAGEGSANKEDWKDITKATLHHILNNSHHPEYHLEDKTKANISVEDRDKSDECVDASLMPPTDIVEMVADWQAMSEELGTNTAREWFNEVKDVRWHFSEEQEELIDKLLKVFE